MKRFALLMMEALLVGLVIGRICEAQTTKEPKARPLHAMVWVSVKDAYEVHERYVVKQPDGSQTLIGEFYVVQPGDVRAQCAGGAPQSFDNLQSASWYVQRCKVTP